jgi:phosphoserine phosphatase
MTASSESSGASTIGAFFDLDSTILAAPSLEWRFVGYLLERNQLKSAGASAWLAHFAKNILLSPREATEANKRHLAGLRESLARDWALAGAEAAQISGSAGFFPEAIARIAWHQSRGHRVCIVSGTLAVLAREMLHHLPGPIDIIATELETAAPSPVEAGLVRRSGRDRAAFGVDDDLPPSVCNRERVWTGAVSGSLMTGLAKARAVWRFAETFQIDLKQSYAYGDRNSDLPMLDAVGNPVAVNPAKRLSRLARENGWQTVTWKMPPSPSSSNATRNHATHGATQ